MPALHDQSITRLNIIRASTETTFHLYQTESSTLLSSFGCSSNLRVGEIETLIQKLVTEYRKTDSVRKPSWSDLTEILNDVLPPPVHHLLDQLGATKQPGHPFYIATNELNIPWELLPDGNDFLCLKYAVGRQLLQRSNQISPYQQPAQRRALFIGNPSSHLANLPFSEEEIDSLGEILRKYHYLGIWAKKFSAIRATKTKIRDELAQHRYHLIHFSGHIQFDPSSQERTGLVLANGEILTPKDIQETLQGHPWIFLNGCNSAQTSQAFTTAEFEANVSLVDAFLQGGAEVVIGTLWPVFDKHAADFSKIYYDQLLSGVPVGEAVRQARHGIVESNSPDWAAYVLYGDPRALWVSSDPYRYGRATILAGQFKSRAGHESEFPLETFVDQFAYLEDKLRQKIADFDGSLQWHNADGFLAIFGFQSDSSSESLITHNHEERATAASLALQTIFNNSPRALQLTWTIGLATGRIALNAATHKVFGKPVEISLWLAQRAHPGQILATTAMLQGIEQRFVTTSWEFHDPTGQAPAAHSPTAVIVQSIVEDESIQYVSPLIGQAVRLRDLNSAWKNVQEGEGEIRIISGEVGSGKSHLLHAFKREVDDSTALCLLVRCFAQASSYSLVRNIIKFTAQITIGDTDECIYRKIHQLLAVLVGEQVLDSQSQRLNSAGKQSEKSEAELKLERAARVLADLVQNEYDPGTVSNGASGVAPESHQWTIVDAFEHLINSLLAKNDSVVFMIDDIHDADESSLTVLSKVVLQAAKSKLLVVVSHLEGWSPPKGTWSSVSRLRTKLLEEKEIPKLLIQHFQQPVANDVIREIYVWTKGNPLFVVEVARMLRRKQAFILRNGEWYLNKSLSEMEIPQRLESVIHSQIEALPGTIKLVLEQLAILGSQFEEEFALAFLSFLAEEGTSQHIRSYLYELQVDHKVLQKRANFAGYEFVRAILHSEVLKGIRHNHRRHYHFQVTQLIEQEKGRFKLAPTQLARHYYAGIVESSNGKEEIMEGITLKFLETAAQLLSQAGEQEYQNYANRSAVDYYTKAFTVLSVIGFDSRPACRTAANLSRKIGRAYMHLSEWGDALQWMNDGLQTLGVDYNETYLAWEREDLVTGALLHIHTASIYYYQGESQSASDECRKGLKLAEDSQDASTIAEGCLVMGAIVDAQGKSKEAIAYFLRGISYCDPTSKDDLLVRLQDNLSTAYYTLGEWDSSFELDSQGLDYWENTVQNPHKIAITATNLGMIHLNRGKWQVAEQLFIKVEEICEKARDHRYWSLAKINLSWVYLWQNRIEEAEAKLRDALNLVTEHEIDDTHTEAFIAQSEIALIQNHAAEALGFSIQALELAEARDLNPEKCMALRNKGLAYLQQNNLAEAKSVLEASLAIAQSFGFVFETAKTQIALARLAYQRADLADALAWLKEAIQIFTQLGAEPMLRQALDLQSAYSTGTITQRNP